MSLPPVIYANVIVPHAVAQAIPLDPAPSESGFETVPALTANPAEVLQLYSQLSLTKKHTDSPQWQKSVFLINQILTRLQQHALQVTWHNLRFIQPGSAHKLATLTARRVVRNAILDREINNISLELSVAKRLDRDFPSFAPHSNATHRSRPILNGHPKIIQDLVNRLRQCPTMDSLERQFPIKTNEQSLKRRIDADCDAPPQKKPTQKRAPDTTGSRPLSPSIVQMFFPRE